MRSILDKQSRAEAAPRRVLMVAYHFPPLAGSSGIQRTLRFVQQLPALGWQPLVLGAHPRAFERISSDLKSDVPPETIVRRAFALDAARHLSVRGRYLDILSRPDRWMSWKFDGVRTGMQMVREFKPDVIWSTYPIATAHAIGAELQRRTGLPWVADFRDPMAQAKYPADPKVWNAYKRIEELAAERASLCTFTTPSAVATYRGRYPAAAARMVLMENGYDEASFLAATGGAADQSPLNPDCVTLLHSGIVYPAERDPSELIEALARLRQSAPSLAARLRLRFRAPVHEELLRQLIERHAVADLVELCPPIDYAEALSEMLRADALMVMQGAGCNEQIPAKIYEYLRAYRPIVCLSDPEGDTWAVLRQAGLSRMAPLDDVGAISTMLEQAALGNTDGLWPQPDTIAAASRHARSVQLASCLDKLTVTRPN